LNSVVIFANRSVDMPTDSGAADGNAWADANCANAAATHAATIRRPCVKVNACIPMSPDNYFVTALLNNECSEIIDPPVPF
jgi:hypothetical protein